MKLILVVLVVLGLSACALKPVNPTGDLRGEIMRMNNMLSLAVGQVARAQKEGLITAERETELLNKLDYAATAMQIVRVSVSNGDRTAGDHLQQARDHLSEVKNALLREAIEQARTSDDAVPVVLIEDVSND